VSCNQFRKNKNKSVTWQNVSYMLLFVILLRSLHRSIVKSTKIFYKSYTIFKMHHQLYFISSTERAGWHMLRTAFTTENTLKLKCVTSILKKLYLSSKRLKYLNKLYEWMLWRNNKIDKCKNLPVCCCRYIM